MSELESQDAIGEVEEIVDESHIEDESVDEVVPAEGVEEVPDAPPAYVPNYSFKYDGEDREFDERVKPFIKDAETEEVFRDLHQRAYGLDMLKEQRQLLRDENQHLMSSSQQRENALKTLNDFVKQDNLDPFFETFQLSEDQVMKYALKKLQLREMSPEDRQAYEQTQGQQTQNYMLQQQVTQMQNQMGQYQVQTREADLNNVISAPEVSEFVQSFDQRYGRQGAFRDEVIKRGIYHAKVNNYDIPAQQAVQEVLQLAGFQGGQSAGGSRQTPLMRSAENTVVVRDKPTLPHVGQGSGRSPVKQSIKDFSELYKIREQKLAGL